MEKVREKRSSATIPGGPKGKIEVIPSKPSLTQYDLSLAYTPGVAIPVREIAEDLELAYEYTAKGILSGNRQRHRHSRSWQPRSASEQAGDGR